MPAPLQLSASHLAELVREIAPLVIGLTIRDVEPLPPADLLLVLENPDENASPRITRLRLSADPAAPRVHVQHDRIERHQGPVGPFYRRIAQDLVGARIHSIEQVAHDRVAILELRDTPSNERRALVVELFGRHANLALLGPGDRVLAVLVPPPPGKADPRLALDRPWVPPSAARRIETTPDLGTSFPAPRALPNLRFKPTDAPLVTAAPLSWIVECALGARADDALHATEQKKLEQRAERKLARARALLAGLEQRAAASATSARVLEDGELLKANLSAIVRGRAHVEVDDFYAPGTTRRIALDPKLSPHENLARTFDRARKLERARGQVEGEIALARARIQALEELLERAREPDADCAALDAQAVEAGFLDPPQEADPRKKKAPEPRLPYRVFRALHGAEIRVGRSARDNDELTFRHARGNDVWLHTADAPGSHVVLRVAKDAEPDAEDLLDAAHLAVHFSPLEGSRRARVHVARQKEVHKPRGAKPGLVTLSGGRNLDVRMQPERIARLLHSHRAGEPTPGAG